MAAQRRVPGETSSEVDFELERFERTQPDRVEIEGRWYGLRGRRFVRPVLNLHTDEARRRLVALLEHKPWAADDGEPWIAAFHWPADAGEIVRAELEVGPALVVELPAPGDAGVGTRVRALRPPPAPPPLNVEAIAREAAERGRADAAREFADRESTERSRAAAARALADRNAEERDAAEQARSDALALRDAAVSQRDAAVRDRDRAVAERDEAHAERDRLQTELDRVAHERDVAYAERNRALQETEAVARDRDQAAAERDGARAELARALPAREQALRERDAQAVRADQAESERDTAIAERKSAVAQRDRARRERDRAMRAVGLEPSEELDLGPPTGTTRASRGDGGDRGEGSGAAAATAAPRTGAPIPSRPVKRIGVPADGTTPEAKPILTPVIPPRRTKLSRSRTRARPAPSAGARWAVRVVAVLLLIASLIVLAILLGNVL
jgi:hypothetical protein